jgi:hypothetical protein
MDEHSKILEIDGGGFEIHDLNLPSGLSFEKIQEAVSVIEDWEASHRSACELIADLYRFALPIGLRQSFSSRQTRESGYPVRRGPSVNRRRFWNTGSSAFADDDD